MIQVKDTVGLVPDQERTNWSLGLLRRAAMEEAGLSVMRESRVLKEGGGGETYESRRALTGSRRPAGTDVG